MPARLTLAITAALALSTHAAAAATHGNRLLGTVGPGFDITLKNSSGTPLIRLHHGTYTLVVRDRSGIHDFHLIGPGVNRVITSVGFVGAKTVRVTLRPGRYRYICDPHAFVMHGSFRVT